MKKTEINKKRKAIGLYLKEQRLLKRYSLRHAAKLCKTDHQRIMDIECGKNFTFDTLCRLVWLYDLEVGIIQKSI